MSSSGKVGAPVSPINLTTVAASVVLENFLLAADANPAVEMLGDGSIKWGPGGAGGFDTGIRRGGASQVAIGNAASTSQLFIGDGGTGANTLRIDPIDHANTIYNFTGAIGIGTASGDILLTPATSRVVLTSGSGLISATGAPSNANGSNGDFYLRTDGGAGTAIYQKRAGVWVGIV